MCEKESEPPWRPSKSRICIFTCENIISRSSSKTYKLQLRQWELEWVNCLLSFLQIIRTRCEVSSPTLEILSNFMAAAKWFVDLYGTDDFFQQRWWFSSDFGILPNEGLICFVFLGLLLFHIFYNWSFHQLQSSADKTLFCIKMHYKTFFPHCYLLTNYCCLFGIA